MIANPRRDPEFSQSPIHGAEAQERLVSQVLRHCGRRTAVDAGAHIGLWSRTLTRHFKRVVAFEPIGENYACLVRNAPGAEHVPAALGAETGWMAPVLPDGGNSGMWRLEPAAAYGVRVYALDSFGYDDVDLLKIDTEGMEGAVVLGARVTLALSRPAVFFEDNGLGPRYYGTAWVDPKPILKDLGYRQAVRIAKNELWVR